MTKQEARYRRTGVAMLGDEVNIGDLYVFLALVMNEHKTNCKSGHSAEWSGSLNPEDPDNSWICDECHAVIAA